MFIVMNDNNKTGLIAANISSFYCKGNFLFINMLEFEKPVVKILEYDSKELMLNDMETLGQDIRDFLELSTFHDLEVPNKVGYLTDAVSNQNVEVEIDEELENENKIGFKTY